MALVSPGVFNRMLVVDPPYIAVVDPAEHDERTDGIEGERDRQQHGDGHGRTNSWKHADGCAHGDAGECP